ncbi:MAG TPA: hypothetical protein VG367_04815 [Mucilaginibacter sp.]|nr:hypothetical protein [Mucilaginibacter sp.]
MKTNQISFWIAAIALVAMISSCSKKETTNTVKPVIPPSHPISAGNISGFIKGTLLTGSTYTVTADVYVKAGDTLLAQPGAIVVVKNNSQFIIQGVFQSMGSQAAPVSFNSDSNTPGTWGGFACDSAQAVTIQWTKILNTGGPDNTGSARRTLVVSAPIKVDLEDNWIENGQDDGLGLFGGCSITVLRNTIQSGGSTDGEAINIKTGAKGVVAYNVVFSQAGTGTKLETASVVTTAETNVDVYNNTYVSCGWRRGAAEPGRGVSAGVSARGNIYNNIIVNCYHGIEIFQDADVANVKYGNNLFYSTANTFVDATVTPNLIVDLRSGYYPAGAAGVPQSSDLISTAVGNNDPMFTSFDNGFLYVNGAPNSNDFHLKSGSPAIGKGNTSFTLANPSLAGGAAPDADMGAYPTDGKGNKH